MECVFALFPRKTRGWRWIAETSDYHVCSRKFAVETDGLCSALWKSYDRAHVLRSWQIITGGLGISVCYVARWKTNVFRERWLVGGTANSGKEECLFISNRMLIQLSKSQSKRRYLTICEVCFTMWYDI